MATTGIGSIEELQMKLLGSVLEFWDVLYGDPITRSQRKKHRKKNRKKKSGRLH